MYEFIGWLSAAALSVCSLPLAIAAYQKRGRVVGSTAFLGLWMLGEITGLAYAVHLSSWPLIANYGINTVLLGYVLSWHWGEE